MPEYPHTANDVEDLNMMRGQMERNSQEKPNFLFRDTCLRKKNGSHTLQQGL
jgi:hypothetical protein